MSSSTTIQSSSLLENARRFIASQTFYNVAKAGLTLFTLVSIGAAAWKLLQFAEIGQSLGSFGFVCATAMAILYRITNPLGWVAVLRGFGHRVDSAAAINVWLMAESRRWLPGGIWGYTSRAVRAKSLGVPAKVASASILVELIVTLLAAVLVSLVGLALHYAVLEAIVTEKIAEHVSLRSFVLGANIALAMAGFSFVFRAKLVGKLKMFSEKWRLLDSVTLSFRHLALAVGYMVIMAGLNGLVNSVMLNHCTDVHVPVTAMIAATAAAWIIGYLAFFSPGGLFVREGALAVLLMPWVPYQAAFMLAILSRIAQLIAEVLCMAVPLLVGKSREEKSLSSDVDAPGKLEVPEALDATASAASQSVDETLTTAEVVAAPC